MRISDWSSDVCSSDLRHSARPRLAVRRTAEWAALCGAQQWRAAGAGVDPGADGRRLDVRNRKGARLRPPARAPDLSRFRTYSGWRGEARSEEHTSELQSLMRISYAVFCLKKKSEHIYTTVTHVL